MYFKDYSYMAILYSAFLASLTIYASKGQPLYVRLLPFFLALTLIIESAGNILMRNTGENMIVYRYFVPVELVYYLYISYNVLSKKWQKKIIAVSILLYVLITVIDFTFFPSDLFPTLIYATGTFLVLFFYLLYFYELIDYPITRTPKREPPFWILLGITVFFSVSLPIWILGTLLNKFSWETLDFLNWITWGLNCFLYTCIAISFFCKGIFREKSILY